MAAKSNENALDGRRELRVLALARVDFEQEKKIVSETQKN